MSGLTDVQSARIESVLTDCINHLRALMSCEADTGCLSEYFYAVGTEQTEERYNVVPLVIDCENAINYLQRARK